MKKYLIIFILFIAGIIILIQTKKTPSYQIPQTHQQSSEIKIGKEIQKDIMPPPQTTGIQQSISPSYMQTISPSYMQITGCTKTFEDILLEFGKEWGPMHEKKLLSSTEETNNIISMIDDYLKCYAIVSDNPDKCNLFNISKEGCLKNYYNYKFHEFFFGANKNEKDCITYIEMLKKNPKDDDKKITSINSTAEKICSEIKNDIIDICGRLFKTNSSERDKCYKIIPKNILDYCPMRDKNRCINSYELAKKSGDLDCDLFNENIKELCEKKKVGLNSCNDKLQKLVLTYCSYQENIKKKLIEMEEKKKIEEEKEKLRKAEEERKKIEGEIIKKAKQAAEEAKKFKGRKYEEEEE